MEGDAGVGSRFLAPLIKSRMLVVNPFVFVVAVHVDDVVNTVCATPHELD